MARRQTLRLVPDFQAAVALARGELAAAQLAAHEEGERKHEQLGEQRDRDLAAAKAEWKTTRRGLKAEHAARTQQLTQAYAVRREALEETHERQFQQLEEQHPPQLARLQQDFAEGAAQPRRAASRSGRRPTRRRFAGEWTPSRALERRAGRVSIRSRCDERRRGGSLSPWETVDLRQPAAGEAAALAIGRCELRLDQLPGGLPAAEQLEQPPAAVRLPGRAELSECPVAAIGGRGRGPRGRGPHAAERDAAAADDVSAGQGAVHDHRSGGPGRRTSRRSCTWPITTSGW